MVAEKKLSIKPILIKSALPDLELCCGGWIVLLECLIRSVKRNNNNKKKRWIMFSTKYSRTVKSTREIILVVVTLFFLTIKLPVSFTENCNGYRQRLFFILSFSYCSMSSSLNLLLHFCSSCFLKQSYQGTSLHLFKIVPEDQPVLWTVLAIKNTPRMCLFWFIFLCTALLLYFVL